MCGFVAPPAKFQDPDVDTAKQLDLRGQDDGNVGSGTVQGLEDATHDLDGDGLDDNTGEPIDDQDALQAGADDAQPLLACPSCGYEVEAGEPTSTNTADPQAGDVGAGPAEGDLCPNCAKAPLMSGTELSEVDPGMDPNADPEADPNADPDAEGDARPFGEDDGQEPDDDSDPDGHSDFADGSDDSDDDQDDAGPVQQKKRPVKR